MKYAIFSHHNYFLPLVQKLKAPYIWADMDYESCEDEPVKHNQLNDFKEQCRLLQGKGVITRHPAQQVVDKLLSVPASKDVTVIFDFNHGTKYGEALKKHGYHGVFALNWAYDLERKRETASKMVAKLYKDVSVPREMKFGTGSADRMIQFMEQNSDSVWVVKPNSEGMWVFCPRSEEPPIALDENVRHINAHKAEINAIPFILQEKIIGTEINIETGYHQGKPVYAAIDLENKFMETEELGHQSGCAFDLVKFVPLDCELRRMCNQPFDAFAKKTNFTGLMDMNAIISAKDGKPYFIEFCPNRFGYNALFTEIEAYGKGVDGYLKDFTTGAMAPDTGERYAASIKLFNRDYHEDFYKSMLDKEYEPVEVTVEPAKQATESEDGIWLWDIFKEKGKTFLANYSDDSAVVTASSDTPEGAIEKAKFKAERMIDFDGKYFRGDIDEYQRLYNPVYRYKYLRDRRLLEPNASSK